MGYEPVASNTGRNTNINKVILYFWNRKEKRLKWVQVPDARREARLCSFYQNDSPGKQTSQPSENATWAEVPQHLFNVILTLCFTVYVFSL